MRACSTPGIDLARVRERAAALSRALRTSLILMLITLAPMAGIQGLTAADAPVQPSMRHLDPNALARRRGAVLTYADQRYREYQAIIAAAERLQAAIAVFIATPTDETLAGARQAWSAAHRCYSPSECHRFYGGPIDEPGADLENKINAWPIDESCIDYVAGDAGTGVINQPERIPDITPAVLIARNRLGGEKNVSIGYHAIEFLLWGQGHDARGPGVRTAADYRLDGGAAHADRRATYLRVVAQLLVDHLRQVAQQWEPDVPGTYRQRFLAGDANAALRKIVMGIAALSGDELACERMAVAYESHSMEDGQSCFSFTTLDDLIGNLEGITATYLGPGAPGLGISDLVKGVDADLDRRIRLQLALSMERMRAIPAPFGVSIQGDDSAPGRLAIHAAITALEPQRLLLMHAAQALGIPIQLGKDPDRVLKRVEVSKPD